LITRPLSQLLMKHAFTLDSATDEAFNALKKGLVAVPTLQLSDFDATIIVNCNASGTDFGVALH
jgi:hypothetical protein